jgi:hypothetical protein
MYSAAQRGRVDQCAAGGLGAGEDAAGGNELQSGRIGMKKITKREVIDGRGKDGFLALDIDGSSWVSNGRWIVNSNLYDLSAIMADSRLIKRARIAQMTSVFDERTMEFRMTDILIDQNLELVRLYRCDDFVCGIPERHRILVLGDKTIWLPSSVPRLCTGFAGVAPGKGLCATVATVGGLLPRAREDISALMEA